MLKNENETWTRNPKTLKEMTLNFFKNMHCSKGPRDFDPVLQQFPALVTNEMNEVLSAEISLLEVQYTIFQMGSLKDFGLDGLNGLFYHQKWEEIKLGIIEEVHLFFNTGYLNLELNITHITIVPKVKIQKKPDQF